MTTCLRIAVADDEPEMREFFARMLPRLGHQVVALAENGAQLIDACRRVRPDLVITDLKMPGVDGLSACDQIGRELSIPVILISALHKPPRAAEASGPAACLVKPIGLADLAPAIELAMRRANKKHPLGNQ